MPRPRSLTPDQLARAALAVLDRDGLAGLSMRTVAAELGKSTMAVYRYVEDREELERLVVEQVLSRVELTAPDPALPWRERITDLVGRLRNTVDAHPEVIPLTMAHRHRSPTVLRWSEAVLAILGEAGVKGEARVLALRGLLSYFIGAIQLEHLGPLSGKGTTSIAELPESEYPLMAGTAREARRITPEDEFFGGLRLLLAGIEG